MRIDKVEEVVGGAAVYFSAGAGGLLCRDCEVHYVEKRWVPAGMARGEPRAGDPRAWFELLDYHISHVAGRRAQTADKVEGLLARGGAG